VTAVLPVEGRLVAVIDLAVATRAETFDRLQEPLAERGIRVGHLQVDERTVALDDPPWDSFDVGYVYPSRLMEGAVADAWLDLPWLNGRDAVLRSRNKAGVLARLDAAGVPTPQTTLVSDPVGEAAVARAVDRFDPPIVVKPNSTTRGAAVTRVHDRDAATGVGDLFDLLHTMPAIGDRTYLLQEFVPDARDYRVMVLDGVVVGCVERRGEGWRHNVHRGASAVGVEPPERVAELARRTADVLDIRLLGVDVLVADDGDGRAVVNETNARPTVDDEKYDSGFYDRLATAIEDVAAT
jgi:ribosomal protein S6--L-glutamate ligase